MAGSSPQRLTRTVATVLVGVPSEVKDSEFRVAITPAGVHEFVRHGHDVLVQRGAGIGSAIPDADFAAAGARIADSAVQVWEQTELILKVKEPIPQEYAYLRREQILFTFLHLAASRGCTTALLNAGTSAIAYETVQLPDGSLPLLAPMSEVAGRMAPQVGAHHLERAHGGRGVLLAGVPGVRPGLVVIVGAGISGMNAALIAQGMEAEVLLMDSNVARLREIDRLYGGERITTLASTTLAVSQAVVEADLVIGAVLVPGAKAPVLIDDAVIKRMKPGAVLVDISIDQGGCFEHSRPTTHSAPTFEVHDVVFYCVANMPGAVPATSTYALTNVTLSYALTIADEGLHSAAVANSALAAGITCVGGTLTSEPVAQAHGMSWQPWTECA